MPRGRPISSAACTVVSPPSSRKIVATSAAGFGGAVFHRGYGGLFVAEYYLATGDRTVLPWLEELAGLLTADPPAGTEVTGTILASILGRLGEISGRVFTEHLLETVFSKFCVGK